MHDDIAAGLIMQAALRERHPTGSARIVVAIPIVSADTEEKVACGIDDLMLPDMREYYFGGVGVYGDDFPPISDDEVVALLREANSVALVEPT